MSLLSRSSGMSGQFLDWPTSVSEWSGFLSRWGMETDVSVRALALGWYAHQLLGVRLVIISGFRDPARQTALRRQWDAGCRSACGIAVRPAERSAHSDRIAFDVTATVPPTPAQWVRIGEIGEALGLRWGGRFSTPDRPHFDGR